MPDPFIENPLGGLLGPRTATFYRLDPLGLVPIEPLADLVPILSPNRVVLDMIDSEDHEENYIVTRNALQDFTSATSNVHREPELLTLSGTLVSSIDLAFLGSVGLGGIPGFGGGLRKDLLVLKNLQDLGRKREPVLVVTPRRAIKAFIESIMDSWSPDVGENTIVTVTLSEARIVNPLSADAALPDVAGSNTGNNAVVGQGTQAPSAVSPQLVSPSAAAGVAPFVVPA